MAAAQQKMQVLPGGRNFESGTLWRYHAQRAGG